MRSCTRRSIAPTLLLALLAEPARAEIAGQQVVVGEATFDQNGNITTIHASDGTIINYSQFGVLANEQLHFVQPSSESRVLNRVFGDATHIDGGLYANGIVYIVNPAGIFFGSAAIVDVGGLYAAAGDISNEDFLGRVDRFTVSGPVENAGSIEAPAVALVGTAVANHGNIVAPDGTIALVAGEKVLLTQLGAHLAVQVDGAAGSAKAPAIEQAGTVDAGAGGVSFTTGDVYSLAINHTGITRGREIELSAGSGTVQVAGTLDASDRSAGATGGSIAVTAERVALLAAQLDASGDAGGGEIRVGGDLHGEGALPTARRTYVDEATELRADAETSGDGGRVVVWSDEATGFNGTLSARGGAGGGDGGFAEISSAGYLDAHGDVDLSAPAGATGTLLYDPKDIVITGGSNDGSDDEDTGVPATDADRLDQVGRSQGTILFADPSELTSPFTIYESEIESTDADIVLEATNSITSSGAFDHIADGEAVGVVRVMDGNALTMRTRNGANDAGTFAPGIALSTLTLQTSGGGAIALSTGGGNIAVGALDTSGASDTAGDDGGAVTLSAGGTGTVTVAGAIDTSGGVGASDAGGDGGAVSITTADGAISLASVNTAGGAGNGGAGAGKGGAVTISAGGDGSVKATGAITTSGGSGTGSAAGAGGGVSVTTADGKIELASVDASGGASNQAGGTGGAGGAITLTDNDADKDGQSDVVVSGALIASGGAESNGTGGAASAIRVRSVGASDTPFANGSPATVTKGGGDLLLHDVTAQGGAGGTGGGAGAQILLDTTDGAITAVDLDSSGGHGATTGGAAGPIGVTTKDANGDLANAITLGNVRAVGGQGDSSLGGAGGSVTIATSPPTRIVDPSKPADADPLQDDEGGGNVTIASIDTRGGEGGTLGGGGGNAALTARGAGKTVLVNGPIVTTGGFGNGPPPTPTARVGGKGGDVAITVEDADLAIVAPITTRGGDRANSAALGGEGGKVTLRAGVGFDDDDSGSIRVGALIDASEGTSGANADLVGLRNLDGGDVSLEAADNLDAEQDVSLVKTTGDVTLSAGRPTGKNLAGKTGFIGQLTVAPTGDVTVTGPFRVSGSNEYREDPTSHQVFDNDALSVQAGGTANVSVDDGRFRRQLGANATELDAHLTVTQCVASAGCSGPSTADVITMDGDGTQMHVTKVDSRASGKNDVDMVVKLDDTDDDVSADGDLVLDTGAIVLGHSFTAQSDGNVIVGTTSGTVIRAGEVLGANDATGERSHLDSVGLIADIDADGTGAVLDASGAATGVIDLAAFDPAKPGALAMFGSQGVGTASEPITTAGGGRLSALVGPRKQDADPNTKNGTIADPAAKADIAVRNTVRGDLSLAKSSAFSGIQGVQVGVGTGDISIRNDVGDISVEGPVSSKPSSAQLGPGGDLTLSTSGAGSRIVLDTTSTLTSGRDQLLDGDVAVAQNFRLSATRDVRFTGKIDADADATSSVLTIGAGRDAVFDGDIGVDTPDSALTGLAVTAGGRIVFDAAVDQSVAAGASGIHLDAGGNPSAVPSVASVAKTGGDLTLTSTGGAVTVGDGDKLSVEGDLLLVGDSVRFTDLSALAITVQSPSTAIFARPAGPVLLPGGALAADAGTDVIANTVSFVGGAPVAVGGGSAPRIATPSGAADNAGGIGVVSLLEPVTPDRIATGDGVLDLVILVPDPGHETPELFGPVIPPLAPQPSEDRAAPGAPVSREEVAEFLACATFGDEGLPAGCEAAAPPPAYGSALDTDRASGVAFAYRELLGDSPRATAGRAAIARAGEDPRAPLGSGSPAANVYLTEIARVLGEVRLLGLGDRYPEVRKDVLEKVAAAIGSPQVDARRLGAAVDARAMGMPI